MQLVCEHLPSTAGAQLRCGTRRQATVVHGPNATLVGSDSFGNKYYQRMTEQFGALLLALLTGDKAGTRSVVPVCATSAPNLWASRVQAGTGGWCTGTWTGRLGKTPRPFLQSGMVRAYEVQRGPGAFQRGIYCRQALNTSCQGVLSGCLQAG